VRGLSSNVAGFAMIAVLLTASGCGSSSVSVQTGSPAKVAGKRPGAAEASSAGGGVSVRSLERALAHGAPPRPTTVTCRASSSAERSTAPFGHTLLPLFTCELTLTGDRASYVVQVLHNGCFVAERRHPGRAVYGCGADRS
jgi:hypothetical protein